MAEQTLTYDERVIALMSVLVKTETADNAQTRDLFNLHNEKFKPRETGRHCSSCRSRVYNRMKEYYNSIKDNEEFRIQS